MGYYTRIFCKADKQIDIETVLATLASKALPNAIVEDSLVEEDDGVRFDIEYNEANNPIQIEYSNTESGLGKAELSEFVDLIKDYRLGISKYRVLFHLKKTKGILAFRVPGDIDETGWQIIDAIKQLYIDSKEGIEQADAEGFYIKGKLILPQQ